MKRFLLGFLLSMTLVSIVVVITVVLPSQVTTDLLSSEEAALPSATDISAETIDPEETPLPPASDTYLEHLTKGDTLMKSGFPLLAAVEYQLATELEPERSDAFFRLGEAQFRGEKVTAAREALTQTLVLNPAHETARLLLGKTYLKLEQFTEARTLYDNMATNHTEALYYQGLLAAFFGEEAGARTALAAIIEKGDDPDYSKNAQRFLDVYDQIALAEDAPNEYGKTLLAQGFAESDEPRFAIPILYDVLRNEPSYRDAWIILGYAYLTLNQFNEAQDALFKAVELDPVKAESRYFLGLSYFGLDDYGAAITQLELAISGGFEPKVQAYQKLGDAAVLAQNYPKAAEAYEKVLVLNSGDIELFVRPIWLHLEKLNRPERARELAEEAVRKHPSEAMGYNLLAWAELALNEFEAAEKNLNYALIIDPNLAAAHYNFGQLHEKRGRIDDAKAEYKDAYTLDPGGSIGNRAAEAYNRLVGSG